MSENARSLTVSDECKRWIGERDPHARTVKNGIPNYAQRRAACLRQSVDVRLVQEFQIRADSRTRWLDVIRAETPWSALDDLRDSTGFIQHDVFARIFNAAVTSPPVPDADKIARQLTDYYLSGAIPRLASIFRELFFMPPLHEPWTGASKDFSFPDPGGISAIHYAIGTPSAGDTARSIIQSIVIRLASLYVKESSASLVAVEHARLALRESIVHFTNLSSTPNASQAQLAQMSRNIQAALIQWMNDVRDQRISAAFGRALIELSGENAIFDFHFSTWRAKIESVAELLTQSQSLQNGIEIDAVRSKILAIFSDENSVDDFRELPTPPPLTL